MALYRVSGIIPVAKTQAQYEAGITNFSSPTMAPSSVIETVAFPTAAVPNPVPVFKIPVPVSVPVSVPVPVSIVDSSGGNPVAATITEVAPTNYTMPILISLAFILLASNNN